MRIGNKLFPYPTIKNNSLDNGFKENVLNIIVDANNIIETYDKITIKNVSYNANSEFLKYINQEKIKVYMIVESSSTIYREEFELMTVPIDIELEKDNLQNNVEFSFFAVATNEILDYRLTAFDETYSKFSFNIDKNNILISDDGFDLNIFTDTNIDNRLSSIFLIIKDTNLDDVFKVYSNKKIVIQMPEKEFSIYENIKNTPGLSSIFFSTLLIPALFQEVTRLVYHIKENREYIENIYDVINEYLWFQSIKNQYYDVFGNELTLEILLEIDVLELCQKLVGNPMAESFSDIENIIFGGEEYE